MATRNWQVKRLSAALGAEVTGVTLANADAGDAADIRALLHEHMVLFFPGQFMKPEDHIAYGRHFGVLEGHSPIMSTLRSDATLDIYATQGATPEKLSIAGGFAEVNEKGLTVLAERVIEAV